MVETQSNKSTEVALALPPPPDVPEYKETTVETYNPEADLLVGRTIRGLVTKELVRTKIPTDPKEVATLLAVLKDQDATALAIIRAKIDKEAGDLSSENAALVRAVIGGMRSVKHEDLLEEAANRAPAMLELPELPDDAVVREFVPGELDVGATDTTFADFSKRVNGNVVLSETDTEDE